jgi:hypothetical protein
MLARKALKIHIVKIPQIGSDDLSFRLEVDKDHF